MLNIKLLQRDSSICDFFTHKLEVKKIHTTEVDFVLHSSIVMHVQLICDIMLIYGFMVALIVYLNYYTPLVYLYEYVDLLLFVIIYKSFK